VKIDELIATLQAAQPKLKPRSQEQDQKFARTLFETVTQNQQTANAPETGKGTASVLAASPAARIQAAGSIDAALEVEKTIELLDQYGQALADSAQSLKQISPLVRDLEKESARLSQLSREISADSGLQPVLNRTAVLAAVEAIKFNRGDYL